MSYSNFILLRKFDKMIICKDVGMALKFTRDNIVLWDMFGSEAMNELIEGEVGEKLRPGTG